MARTGLIRTMFMAATAIIVCAVALSAACSPALSEESAVPPASWYEKGLKFVDMTRYNEAIDCFDRAIDLDPNNEQALFARGSTLLVVGRFEDAYRDLNRALAIDPADAGAYYVRGLVYEQANNYENAAADYTTALTIDPRNGDYLFRRGLAYREMGKTDEAISDFRRACELGYGYVCDELNAMLERERAN
jgi:tetratricopeptide (TPR) repeat protein